ncbi:MAG: protease pro-enzyme activation domain-containing protein [Bryobacteraceae bacterium]
MSGELLQAQVPARITQRPDNSVVVRLNHTTHPAVGAARDLGRVAPNLAMERILLQLQSTPEQESALEQLLGEQQDVSSPQYHAWLTPDQFGDQFGVAQPDLDVLTAWLASAGFQVTEVARSRRTVEFSGAAADVERAFHTEIHNYDLDGERHIANSTDISIPEALAPVVAGVASLHNFQARPMHHMVRAAPGARGGPSEAPAPRMDLGNGTHGMAPYDFAAIYDVSSLWNANYDGAGQSIAVLGESNIKLSDVAAFRAMFGLPANPPQIIVVNGNDPGDVGGSLETEADLDVEWAGAVAKGATIKYVVSKSTFASDGVTLAAEYAVNNNVAPVITLSFGLCEAFAGMSNQVFNALWQQAAAQGISVFVGAGDSGSAGCDTPNLTTPAQYGFGVNGLGSSSYNVAVGGTEFDDSASPSTYWNPSNGGNLASAKGYIPELVWNESSYSSVGAASNSLWAAGGGSSNQWPRPAWQTGAGVPAGTFRLVPDVSLTAAGHDGYLIEQEGTLYQVGGTSASTPSFAGIMAILNQYTGARNGNPNAKLYGLAASTPAAYHDITAGSNAVPCTGGTPNCSAGLPATNVGKMTGYSAGPGYDLATGLGSVDAYALARGWGGAQVGPSITSLSPNPMKGSNTAQALTINGTGFAAGLSIKVGTVTYGPSQLTSVSGTKVVLNVTVGTAAQNLAVEAINTTGPASNTAALPVTGPAPAISGLSPNPMTGSNSGQVLTITGTGFQSGLTLQMGPATPASSQLISVTPTGIQVNLVVGLTARTFAVTVTNPDGQVSNSVNFQVNAPLAAPSITSLSPNPMKGSNTAQALTINGTGFVAGLSIKVGTVTYGPSQLTSVSGTKVVLNVTVGTAAQNLAVEAINTAGPASNTAILQVTGPAPAISALSPNPMTGSNSGQVLTITGTNFQSGLTLQVGSTTVTSSQLMSVTATRILVNLVVGLATRPFAVSVKNPDGQVSNSVNFQVNAPPAPSITSLNPSQVTGSNAAQTLTINGTGFQSGAGLTVLVGATNYTGSQVTFVSGSQIKVSVVTGVGARTLNVRVTNASGMASNLATLTVK